MAGDVGVIKVGTEDIIDAKADMVLDEGVEVIVGQKSAIELQVNSGQIITFRRMTSAVITRAAIESGSINIDVGMKYGQASFEGEAQDRALRTSIHSPGATLAIRGTRVALTDQPPFVPEVTSLTGRVEYSDARKRVALGKKNGGTVRVNQQSDTAAETALAASYVDPTFGDARSPAEQRLVAQVLSTGAVARFQSGFPIVRGGTPPTMDALAKALPLGFSYIFRWTGNLDFNLTVSVDNKETIYPVAGSNRTKDGFTAFDHQGGPHGGYEVVNFPPGYPGSDCIDTGKKDPAGNEIFTGTHQYSRRADFTPNGNSSGYELRAYTISSATNRFLNLDLTGAIGKVGAQPETLIQPFRAICKPATATASSASGTKASNLSLSDADCGCSALTDVTPLVKTKSSRTKAR